MTEDESKVYVDMIVETIPPLVLLTKENYLTNKDRTNESVALQWELMMTIMEYAEPVLTPTQYDRLWTTVESALSEIEAYMEEQDAAVPVESLWNDEEAKLFGVKGA
jgi:hypothetical protein